MRELLILAGALSLYAQAPLPNDRPNERQNPVGADPQAIEAGRKSFVNACAACHGATGEGGRGPQLRDGRAVRRSSDAQLLATLQKGVPGTDMPGSNLPEMQLWQIVAFVRALGAPASETIIPGDPVKGERVYSANGCAGCHMISGRGGTLGPDLSNAGGLRSYENLRESVLKPAARITPGYQKVVATLKDGRSIEGVARNFTNYDLQLQGRDGKLYLLDSSMLADVKVSVATYMPQDYGKRLSREEVTDLLAYLSKQSLRPPAPKESSRRNRGNR